MVLKEAFKESESDKDIESMSISVPSLIRDVRDLLEERFLEVKRNPEALYRFGVMVDELREHIESHMKQNPAPPSSDETDLELDEQDKISLQERKAFKRLNKIGRYSVLK